MSIFSKIGGALKGAIGGFITGGPAGAARGAIGGVLAGGGGRGRLPPPPGGGGAGSWTGPASSRVRRVIPGAGTIGGAITGYGLGRMAGGENGVYMPRRRSRGFSARDVRQAKRIMKMLKDVGAAAPKPRMVRVGKSCD